jgi:hypothetical protein
MTKHYLLGLEKLQGTQTTDGVRYFAHEINSYVTVDDFDVEQLGTMIAHGVDEAYSVWCSETFFSVSTGEQS